MRASPIPALPTNSRPWSGAAVRPPAWRPGGSPREGPEVSSDLMRQVGGQASRANPWPLYAQLRQHRVVPLAEHSYAVGRYDDVLGLLHDPRVSSDVHTLTDPGDRIETDPPAFINQDPPGHDRLRREATRFFGPPDSPGLVTAQEPEIRRQIDILMGAFPESGEIDMVDDFAYPLPVAVI